MKEMISQITVLVAIARRIPFLIITLVILFLAALFAFASVTTRGVCWSESANPDTRHTLNISTSS